MTAAPDVTTFQGLIFALQHYWAKQGCAILQPYDMEMGAGTFHTATFLRAIGPEPWNAAYVQPSRRPADARYGENPFRLQHYYQYQVILKPSPDDIQEVYLDSLRAIGIVPGEHDVRFVEDDCLKTAVVLSYATLLAIVPLTAVGLAALSVMARFRAPPMFTRPVSKGAKVAPASVER